MTRSEGNVLDRVWARHGAHLGELVRYADDFVVMCPTAQACEESQRRIEHVLGRLGLRLKRAGRNLRAGQAQRWNRDCFETLGLHRLRGTIRYPGQAFWQRKTA